MGYIRHHAIIVTTWDIEKLQPAADYAAFLGMTTSPPVASPLNGYVTMLIAPDGSKEGWDASEVGDGQRNQFIEWLDAQRYDDGSSSLRWVEVQYGDDEHETLVIRHSDEQFRIDAANRESDGQISKGE